jgi:tRNA(Ile)-lysidine synthase
VTQGRPVGGPGWALTELVARTIARYDMLSGGEKVVVGVSGGPDSSCLLDVLRRLSGRLDLTLAVAHVDHGLGKGSEAVARAVARVAAASALDVHLVRAPDLAGPNLQARARAFRYGFFATVASEVGARHIATGHTLDDRVETTLARLLHGAGTEGLAGLPPSEEGRIRPLIAVRRSETRAYCSEVGVELFDDPANQDERFERVAVRARLVAAIEERWGDGAMRAIAASAERLRTDSEALAELTDRFYPTVATPTEDGVSFDRASLVALPRALRRRLLERAVGRVRDRSGGIEAALDALERNHKTNARFAVASGLEIVVERARLLVEGAITRDRAD